MFVYHSYLGLTHSYPLAMLFVCPHPYYSLTMGRIFHSSQLIAHLELEEYNGWKQKSNTRGKNVAASSPGSRRTGVAGAHPHGALFRTLGIDRSHMNGIRSCCCTCSVSRRSMTEWRAGKRSSCSTSLEGWGDGTKKSLPCLMAPEKAGRLGR